MGILAGGQSEDIGVNKSNESVKRRGQQTDLLLLYCPSGKEALKLHENLFMGLRS